MNARLSNVTRGRIARKPTVLIYGPEKVGKTRFAAAAKNPLIIDTEKGSGLTDASRYCPESWADIVGMLEELETSEHEFSTVVIDSIDWAERLLHDALAEKAGVATVGKIGYGDGYQQAVDEWRKVLAQLERLRADKDMSVVLVGHAAVKTYKNPEGNNFDRYALKLDNRASQLVKEWVEYMLFASWETHAVEKDGKVRGVSGDALIRTQHTAAYDAGARLPIPETLPLDWPAFATSIHNAFKEQEESKK